jgi:2'-5' RNA ligase
MSLRLFIAISTPPEIKAQLRPILQQLVETRADVRWEPIEKLHATIKFLGSTREELVETIKERLGEIATEAQPPSVRYACLGCFPDKRRPRVIWVGIDDPSGVLAELHRGIDDAMTTLGFECEERAFKPHLTLGRVKGMKGVKRLLETMEAISFDAGPVTLHEIALVRSELKSGGSVYTTLAAFLLGRAGSH